MDEYRSILIVDDSEDDREFFARLLRAEPGVHWSILEAETAEQGVSVYCANQVDCVLLDYSLPGHNGMEFFRQLAERGVHAAVVMLTGQGDVSVSVEAMKRGAHDFLVKDKIDGATLRHAISNAMEKAGLQMEVAEYQRALERSNQELKRFAYAASHDLKSPLNNIMGQLDELKEDYAAGMDTEGRELIDNSIHSAARLHRLITDLLSYALVTSGPELYELVDLNIVADDIRNGLRKTIEEKQATLEFDQLPTIEANPAHMQQLFQNLISNAIKFHRPDVPPVIKVGVEMLEAQNSCNITFRDNGIGFELSQTDRLFAPFQRLVTRNEFEGSGVGLATVKKIVDALGGRIFVDSTPGTGSTFRVTLPLRQGMLSVA